MTETRQQIPLMTLREVVMFPQSIAPLYVGRQASIRAVEQALTEYDKQILLVTQRDPEVENPDTEQVFGMGVVCKILQLLRMPDGTVKVLFEGQHRATWEGNDPLFTSGEEFPVVAVEPVQEPETWDEETRTLVQMTQESVNNLAQGGNRISKEGLKAIQELENPGELADTVVPYLKADYEKKQRILELVDPKRRLEEVYGLLVAELEHSQVEQKINERVKEQIEANQKNYYLNEQLKAIHKEMGLEQEPGEEGQELLERLDAKEMPEDAREKARKEIKKLQQMQPSSAEYTVVRNYVDTVLDLPWDRLKETELDLDQASRILEEDHYGLEKPKERILEFLPRWAWQMASEFRARWFSGSRSRACW